MTETRSEYSVTMDIMIVNDSWEARLLQKARQMRADWLRNRRRMILVLDLDGSFLVFQGEPCGKIETG